MNGKKSPQLTPMQARIVAELASYPDRIWTTYELAIAAGYPEHEFDQKL